MFPISSVPPSPGILIRTRADRLARPGRGRRSSAGVRLGATCPDEGLVGLVTEQLGEARSLGVNGLLHGLHPHPQVAVLRLQHGVFVEHVAETLHAILAGHAFALHGRGKYETVCINLWDD